MSHISNRIGRYCAKGGSGRGYANGVYEANGSHGLPRSGSPGRILVHEGEPTFLDNLLFYEGRYYTVGVGHKAYRPDKALDQDYYLLMLAGIAMELKDAGLTETDVFLAAGLPLRWAGTQKESFRAYLLQKERVSFM